MKVCPVCSEMVSAGQGCDRSDCPNQTQTTTDTAPKVDPGFTGKADRFVQAGLDGAESVARETTRRAFFLMAGVFAAILFAVIFVMNNGERQTARAVAGGVDADAEVRSMPRSFEVLLTSNRLGDCIAQSEILDGLDYSYSNMGRNGFDDLYEKSFKFLDHWVKKNGGIERVSSSPNLRRQIPVPKIDEGSLYGSSVDNRCLIAAKSRLMAAGYPGIEICRDGRCVYEEFPSP